MDLDAFYKRFNAMSIDKRFIILNAVKHNLMTLAELYHHVKHVDEKLKPLLAERTRLIQIADESGLMPK